MSPPCPFTGCTRHAAVLMAWRQPYPLITAACAEDRRDLRARGWAADSERDLKTP